MIIITCNDTYYKETKVFRIKWDGSRDDLDERDEMQEWCNKHNPDIKTQYSQNAYVEGA